MLTQKFSEIAYVSPDFDAYEKEYTIAIQALKDAVTLESQEIAIKHISALAREIETMSSLVYVRHSIDTTDVFYEKEQEKLDHLAPKIQQLTTEYHKVLSASPFKEALSKIYGEQLFVYATLSTKTIKET
jgi:oligoendopeptidase F